MLFNILKYMSYLFYFIIIIICGFVETLFHPIYSDTTLTFSLKYTQCPSFLHCYLNLKYVIFGK